MSNHHVEKWKIQRKQTHKTNTAISLLRRSFLSKTWPGILAILPVNIPKRLPKLPTYRSEIRYLTRHGFWRYLDINCDNVNIFIETESGMRCTLLAMFCCGISIKSKPEPHALPAIYYTRGLRIATTQGRWVKTCWKQETRKKSPLRFKDLVRSINIKSLIATQALMG